MTGIRLHGGASIRSETETEAAGSIPPIRWLSPYGSTITSPPAAQCRSPERVSIHARPDATTWKRIMRSAPGASTAKASRGGSDSYAQGSEYSPRRKIAPWSRSRASASDSVASRSGTAGARSWIIGRPDITLIITQPEPREAGPAKP